MAFAVQLQTNATALGNGSAIDCDSYSWVAIQVQGTFTATVIFEARLDATSTWSAIAGLSIADYSTWSSTVAGTGSAVDTAVVVPLRGFQNFRARVSAYTNGTVQVYANFNSAGY